MICRPRAAGRAIRSKKRRRCHAATHAARVHPPALFRRANDWHPQSRDSRNEYRPRARRHLARVSYVPNGLSMTFANVLARVGGQTATASGTPWPRDYCDGASLPMARPPRAQLSFYMTEGVLIPAAIASIVASVPDTRRQLHERDLHAAARALCRRAIGIRYRFVARRCFCFPASNAETRLIDLDQWRYVSDETRISEAHRPQHLFCGFFV